MAAMHAGLPDGLLLARVQPPLPTGLRVMLYFEHPFKKVLNGKSNEGSSISLAGTGVGRPGRDHGKGGKTDFNTSSMVKPPGVQVK